MISEIIKTYPKTKVVCVGFSMGGNTVCKYLGTAHKDQFHSIIGGVIICGGADVQS